jgi:hypothetical protein
VLRVSNNTQKSNIRQEDQFLRIIIHEPISRRLKAADNPVTLYQPNKLCSKKGDKVVQGVDVSLLVFIRGLLFNHHAVQLFVY